MISYSKPQDFSSDAQVVGCFCENNGAILLLHRQDNKPHGDSWGLPAGKLNFREKPYHGMIREIKEETGIDVLRKDLKLVCKIFVSDPDSCFEYFMFSMELSREKNIRMSKEEHKGFIWVYPSVALTMNLVPDLDSCIRLYKNIH